jgi:hypothetical protein
MIRSTNSYDLRYYYADGTTQTTFVYSNFFQNLDNQWIHVTLICDYSNKTMKAYRNGIQFSSTASLSGTPIFPVTNNAKYVGASSVNNYRLTDGSLDEVRIYNRGLSADEISAQYTSTKSHYGQ